VLSSLRNDGIVGLGQSSWGPTGFAFAASQAEGEALMARLSTRFRQSGLSFTLAQGRNEGAKVEIVI
jgi:predicted sugar kinase